MALVKIAADKRHLVHPRGRPFFTLGVNYVGHFDRAWKMWEPDLFDPDLIAHDFRKAQNSGFNTIRLFVSKALLEEVRHDNFAKLDHTLSLAQDHQLLVLLTLNGAHDLNLERVAELDAKITARYKDVPTVLAYDLENEPVFYNLAAAIYPKAYHPPIHTSQLVDHYEPRVSQAEAAELQRRRRIPGHLDAQTAFYYINALRLFLEYDLAVNNFIKQGRGTLVDFMLAEEATPWHTLISVLDSTVEAWLRARIDPIRAVDCRHLLTVGWSWLHFAALPANRILDFQAYHHYPSLSWQGFHTNLAHLEGLRRACPKQPILLGEFGWSNESSANPATSQPISPYLTALYEAATYAYLRANDFGGAFKWSLNDALVAQNSYEASFGVFKLGDQPKPIQALLHRFSQDWLSVEADGSFITQRDLENNLAYRFDLPEQTTIGGCVYQDETVNWQGEGPVHCFIKQDKQELLIDAYGAGRLSIDPWDFIPTWNRAREANLYRIYSNHQRTRQRSFGAGQRVEVDLRPGAQYVIRMGAAAPVYPPSVGGPQLAPRPGEHVLLLADFDRHLQAALKYIRRFAPDFTLDVAHVGERWAYVSVVAPAEQVPDELLDDIRGAGALLVERIAGETIEATQALLDEMARQGQRFRTAPTPPQEEPPAGFDQVVSPPAHIGETYVVQPGDTLSKIAQQAYGDFRLWPLIFEANRDKLTDPALIRAGMELRIPDRE